MKIDANAPECDGASEASPLPRASRFVAWYSEGERRVVEIDGVRVVIGFVGRKGRRARIAISAPPGATFGSGDGVGQK